MPVCLQSLIFVFISCKILLASELSIKSVTGCHGKVHLLTTSDKQNKQRPNKMASHHIGILGILLLLLK